jgi:hypothetical protein
MKSQASVIFLRASVKRESLLYSVNSWYPKRDIFWEEEEGPQRNTHPIQNYLVNSPICNPTENKCHCCLFKNPRPAGASQFVK